MVKSIDSKKPSQQKTLEIKAPPTIASRANFVPHNSSEDIASTTVGLERLVTRKRATTKKKIESNFDALETNKQKRIEPNTKLEEKADC